MLQERYLALPKGGEKLYISTLIHRFFSLRGQPYFSSLPTHPSSYDKFQATLIGALNDELKEDNQGSYAKLRNLLNQTKVNHDYSARTVVEYRLCSLLSRMGEHHSAKFYCQAARVHLEEMDDPFIPLRDAYRLTANNHTFLGDYKQALDDYYKIVSSAKRYHDNSGIYNDIGNLLTEIGEYTQAEKYLLLAQQERKAALPVMQAQVKHSLASLYYEMGEYEFALGHFEQALKLLRDVDHQYGIALVYIGLGKLHTALGNHDLSNAYLHQALDMASEQNNRAMKTEITLCLSQAYQARSLINVAIDYAELTLESAQDNGSPFFESKALLQLSELYEQNNQASMALDYFKQYHQHEVNQHKGDSRSAFEALDLSKTRLEEELEKSQLILRNTEQELQLENLQQQNVAYALFIVLLGLAVSAMIYANRKVRQLAERDSLTNTLSRIGTLHRVRSQGPVNTPGRKHVLALFDLDKFKLINDAYGHPTGDLALKHVAQTINLHLNKGEFIGRLGGEEFLVFLTDVEEHNVTSRVEMLRMAIASQSFDSEDQMPINLTASFAFLATSEALSDFDVLYSILDQALYQAKQNGRDCIIDAYHDPIDIMPYSASRPMPA